MPKPNLDEIQCTHCSRYSLELDEETGGPRVKCWWCEEVLPGFCHDCHDLEPCGQNHTAEHLLGIQNPNAVAENFSGEQLERYPGILKTMLRKLES